MNPFLTAIEEEMAAIAKKAAEQGWGWWRLTIAGRPLLGFWTGVALGAALAVAGEVVRAHWPF